MTEIRSAKTRVYFLCTLLISTLAVVRSKLKYFLLGLIRITKGIMQNPAHDGDEDNDTKFTSVTKNQLVRDGLYNKKMVRDISKPWAIRTVKWQQVKRNLFGNEEDYFYADFYADGVEKCELNRVMVFVAKSEGKPPEHFNTLGHKGKLHNGWDYKRFVLEHFRGVFLKIEN